MSKARKRYVDRDFQKLAIQVNQTLIDNEGLIGDQQAQVEKVMSLERSFLNVLKRYARTQEVYGMFIKFIVDDLGNILSARPYFRESQKEFTRDVTPAITQKNPKRLMDFHANYMLIHFIVENWGEPLPAPAQLVYDKFLDARRILIENNIPLAINRAKLFYRKVPRGNLSLLDFVDICIHGLISGIDKYQGEYRPVWRSVCIGRMVGYMIEEYSNSLLRMFPTDKKILYRVNSIRFKMKTADINVITAAVNESFKADALEGKHIPKLPISSTYIMELINSSVQISADVNNDSDEYGEEEGLNVYDLAHTDEDIVADTVEKKDLMQKVTSASSSLVLIERKVIRLKGVNL